MAENIVKGCSDKPIRNHLVMKNKETISWYCKHQAKPLTESRIQKNKKAVASVSSCWKF